MHTGSVYGDFAGGSSAAGWKTRPADVETGDYVFPIIVLLAVPGHPFAILSETTWDRFHLVKKLAGFDSRRQFARRVLLERPPPDALLAVMWGAKHSDDRIRFVCKAVLEEWELRKCDQKWRDLVKRNGRDYDRFLNAALFPSKVDIDSSHFARAAEIGRAFNRLLVEQNIHSLNPGDYRLATIFQAFDRFVQAKKPRVLVGDADHHTDAAPLLIRASHLGSFRAKNSIILADGNVDLQDCSLSVVIAGGNISIRRADGSVLFAGGDITFREKSFSTRGLVVAGGKIRIDGQAMEFLAVTPQKVEIAKGHSFREHSRVFDGKREPTAEFFVFNDLWSSFGVRATFEKDQVNISAINPASQFTNLFKERDRIIANNNAEVYSLGQFRRLLRLALDTGEVNFEIERDGKKMNLRADLKKKQP